MSDKPLLIFNNAAARKDAEGNIPGGLDARDRDTGADFRRTSTGWVQTGVIDLAPGSKIVYEIRELSNARQRVEFPSGATAIEIAYGQGSYNGNVAATGRAARMVFNATSTPDADGKLPTAGMAERISLGGDPFAELRDASDPIYIVDLIAEAVESGNSTLFVRARIQS